MTRTEQVGNDRTTQVGMDRTEKIITSVIAGVIVAFLGAWIQINCRIAVLETQVDNDHELFLEAQQENKTNIKEIKQMLTDIQIGVQHLQDVKQDKQ